MSQTVRWPLASFASAAVADSQGVNLDVTCMRAKINCNREPFSANSLQATQFWGLNVSRGDHCTAEQMSNGDTLWFYSVMRAEDCVEQLVKSAGGAYYMSNVSCCTTDLCNAPSNSFDNTASILTVSDITGSSSDSVGNQATLASGNSSDEGMTCYVNVGQPYDPWENAPLWDGTQQQDGPRGARGDAQAAIAIEFPLLQSWQEPVNDKLWISSSGNSMWRTPPGMVSKQTQEPSVCASYRWVSSVCCQVITAQDL
jgi:hypothetical protein